MRPTDFEKANYRLAFFRVTEQAVKRLSLYLINVLLSATAARRK